MKKLLKWFVLPHVLILAVYFAWSLTGRVKEKQNGKNKEFNSKEKFSYIEFGKDSDKGNLIGIQPYLTAINYSTALNLQTSLRSYIEQLKHENKLSPKSILVFPEYIGTWLVAANEKQSIYTKQSITEAMTTMVASNIFSFSSSYLQSPVRDRTKYAIFHMKAVQMARQYQSVFSSLAKAYRCTIVAGSIVLPDPSISEDGRLQVKKGGPILIQL